MFNKGTFSLSALGLILLMACGGPNDGSNGTGTDSTASTQSAVGSNSSTFDPNAYQAPDNVPLNPGDVVATFGNNGSNVVSAIDSLPNDGSASDMIPAINQILSAIAPSLTNQDLIAAFQQLINSLNQAFAAMPKSPTQAQTKNLGNYARNRFKGFLRWLFSYKRMHSSGTQTSTSTSSNTSTSTSTGTSTSTSVMRYSTGISQILGQYCVSCHSNYGSYSGAASNAASICSSVKNGSMPKGMSMPSSSATALCQWSQAGAPN